MKGDNWGFSSKSCGHTGNLAVLWSFVSGWLFSVTKETFSEEPEGDCPVDPTNLFVDTWVPPNTDKYCGGRKH